MCNVMNTSFSRCRSESSPERARGDAGLPWNAKRIHFSGHPVNPNTAILKHNLARASRCTTVGHHRNEWTRYFLASTKQLVVLWDFVSRVVGHPPYNTCHETELHEMMCSVSLPMDVLALLQNSPNMGAQVLLQPRTTLAMLEQHVLPELCLQMLKIHQQRESAHFAGAKLPRNKDMVKSIENLSDIHARELDALQTAPPIRIRLNHLPCDEHTLTSEASSLHCEDVGSLTFLRGRVIRTGRVHMLAERRVFACRTCGHRFVAVAKPELYYRLDLPVKCPSTSASLDNFVRRGESSKFGGRGIIRKIPGGCPGDSFEESPDEVLRTDYQEIRMQCSASARGFRSGASQSLIPVVFLGDLAGHVSPGDSIGVTGIVCCRWQRLQRNTRSTLELFVECNNVIKMNDGTLDHSAPIPRCLVDFLSPYHLQLAVFPFLDPSSAMREQTDTFHLNYRTSSSESGSISMCDEGGCRPSADCSCPNSGRVTVVDRDVASKQIDPFPRSLNRVPSLSSLFSGLWLFVRERQNSGCKVGSLVLPPNYDEWTLRSEMVQAVCPSLHNIYIPKLAVLLVVLSGCPVTDDVKGGEVDDSRSNRWSKYGAKDDAQERRIPQGYSTPHSGQTPMADVKSQTVLVGRTAATSGCASACRSMRDDNEGVKSDPRNSVRHLCHLLFIGGSGTGKSQLIKAASQLAPRAVCVSGMGCTVAGLTCAAVRDSASGDWQLEAGSLVLADDGVCCLDEFSSLKREGQQAILEAMEQQTVSVAKAGMVSKLNSRCSVIAASHAACSVRAEAPPGLSNQYNIRDIPILNSGLSPPLLSRFDVVVVLPDASCCSESTVDFILEGAPKSPGINTGRVLMGHPAANDRFADVSRTATQLLPWTTPTLSAYLSFARQTFAPRLSEQAQQVISTYYQQLRAAESSSSKMATDNLNRLSSTGSTLRLLESLVRLTQAHARLMSKERADRRDAVAVIWTVELSLLGHKVLPSGGVEGRQGLLRFQQDDVADVVTLLARDYKCPSNEVLPFRAAPTNASHAVTYKSSGIILSDAMRCSIKSTKEYQLVEDLVLKKLGFCTPADAEEVGCLKTAGDRTSALHSEETDIRADCGCLRGESGVHFPQRADDQLESLQGRYEGKDSDSFTSSQWSEGRLDDVGTFIPRPIGRPWRGLKTLS